MNKNNKYAEELLRISKEVSESENHINYMGAANSYGLDNEKIIDIYSSYKIERDLLAIKQNKYRELLNLYVQEEKLNSK